MAKPHRLKRFDCRFRIRSAERGGPTISKPETESLLFPDVLACRQRELSNASRVSCRFRRIFSKLLSPMA